MPNTKEILNAIADQLGLSPDDLDRNALLREELGLSSIELNDLLSSLAEKFDVTFEPEELEQLNRVEDLVSLVEDNLLD